MYFDEISFSQVNKYLHFRKNHQILSVFAKRIKFFNKRLIFITASRICSCLTQSFVKVFVKETIFGQILKFKYFRENLPKGSDRIAVYVFLGALNPKVADDQHLDA